MHLINVYDRVESKEVLLKILSERKPFQSISHKTMPTWEEHCQFVDSHPYQHWYVIMVNGDVGTVYLTEQREVGVFISEAFRGRGYAEAAVRMLVEQHPGRILANVNPDNTASMLLWEKLGGEVLQMTYEVVL